MGRFKKYFDDFMKEEETIERKNQRESFLKNEFLRNFSFTPITCDGPALNAAVSSAVQNMSR